METTPVEWTSKAEAAILSLKDIAGVSIQAEGEGIKEIHVLTTANRPPKQIVRDVQTLLLTMFGRPIDHRVVSVAFSKPDTHPHLKAVPSDPTPAPHVESVPTVAPAAAAGPERVRFVSANLYVSGPRVQAQVELKWRGLPRMGSASGWSTRDGAHRLIVSATLAAVQEYLEDEVALSLEGVEIVRLGRRDVAVVALTLLAHREQKTLVGCSTVEQDSQQAVVLATLAALNRVIGGLPSREPSE